MGDATVVPLDQGVRRRRVIWVGVGAVTVVGVVAATLVLSGHDSSRRLSPVSPNVSVVVDSSTTTSMIEASSTPSPTMGDEQLFLDDAGVRAYLGADAAEGVVRVKMAEAGSAAATLTVGDHATIVFGRTGYWAPIGFDPTATSTTGVAMPSTTLPTGVARGPLMQVDEIVQSDLGAHQVMVISNDVDYTCSVQGGGQAAVVALVTTRDEHVALDPDVVARAWIIDADSHHEIDASAVSCDDDYFEPAVLYGIHPCDDDYVCPSFATRADGRVVALDPITGALFLPDYSPEADEAIVVPGLAGTRASLVAIGPDDVAYVTRQTPGQSDPIGDLLAISMAPANPGAILAEVDQAIDQSGDSSLFGSNAGLVSVGCCDFAPVRPDASQAPTMAWVDSSGAVIVDEAPQMSVEPREDGSLDVIRRDGAEEVRWNVADVGPVRGMPKLVATDDGGAMMLLFGPRSPGARIVAMFSDGAVYGKPLATESAPIFALLPDRDVIACDTACVRYPPFG